MTQTVSSQIVGENARMSIVLALQWENELANRVCYKVLR